MNKEQFRQLFRSNARQALSEAERQLGVTLSDDFDIELHGAGVPGEIVTPDYAIERMYISEDVFYRIIDVGVKSVIKNRAVVFVRISAHPPSKFQQTWNTPKGNGPFKVIEPRHIHIEK